MRTLDPDRIAAETGAEIIRRGEPGPPGAVRIDSARGRCRRPLLRPAGQPMRRRGVRRRGARRRRLGSAGGARRGGRDRVRGDTAGCSPSWTRSRPSQALARAWRRELGARVDRGHRVGRQDLRQGHRRVAAARVASTPAAENFNTEIGLPLTVLAAPEDTEVLVLEMAMRGAGQIAELAAIAEPEVAVITNVGPVHVELLGLGRGDRRGQGGDARTCLQTAPRSCPARRRAGAVPRARRRG